MENINMAITPYTFSFGSLGSSIDSLITEMEARAFAAVPKPETIKTTVKNTVPRITGNFNVDVTEVDDALIVTCDLPGFEKSDVSIRLINPETLVIKTQVCSETVFTGTYHLRERRTDAGQRTILLPMGVTAEGAKATFRNGILELVLPKVKPEEGEEIQIE